MDWSHLLPLWKPDLLWMLLFLPTIAILSVFARRRRRVRIHSTGQIDNVPGLMLLNRRARRWGRIASLVALILLVIVIARPRWGKGEDTGVVKGRDLVVVVDLSKSMLAEDVSGGVSRWEATQIGLKTLLDELDQRGGHRIALVVFAAKPWVICPLTSDYDHLRMKIDELKPLTPPPEVYPKTEEEPFISGTRIGEALRYAVTIHDARFAGYQDILLLSDGDDPAPQKDFDVGITAARQTNIPIHVIGIGDKEKKTQIPIEVEGGIPDSQLQEEDLKKIALEARGEYASWNGSIPIVGDFFRTKIEAKPTRELSEDALPQPREQHLWFLVPAMILLILGWWLEERK